MTFLIASIVFNTLLVVIFRYFGRYQIHNDAAIVVNYFVCFLVGLIFTGGELLEPTAYDSKWTLTLLVLGALFIFTFNVVAATVQHFGITIAALLQKMSVVLVVVFSVLSYDERLDTLRIIGLICGLIAIYLITGMRKSKSSKARTFASKNLMKKLIWLLPVIVFLNSGIIDSIFLHVNRSSLSLGKEELFGSWLFLFAGVMGGIVLTWSMINGKRFSIRDVWAGVILGIPNFFSVYFIQKMLTNGMDGSAIFPIHNIGILLLSAVLSKILFQEKFRWAKYLGIVLAVASIILLGMQ